MINHTLKPKKGSYSIADSVQHGFRFERKSALSILLLTGMFVFSDHTASATISPVLTVHSRDLQQQISGRVTLPNGEPARGVTVTNRNTGLQTNSDAQGRFSIAASLNDVLIFSAVGYQSLQRTVTATEPLNISLQSEQTDLGEVVVVGYGTQKKSNVTSAISSIQAEDIITTTNSSLSQSLQGKVPGLQIRHNNSEPGAFSSTINIRGFGNPLFVIDGIVRDGAGEFNQLNPNDIESISVLKDASAAIYGMNAANGVILVTTKKGKSQKATFNYLGVAGLQKPTNIPKMSNAAQYLEMYNDAIFFRDGTYSIAKDELQKWREGGPGYESTDWYEETFKPAAAQQQHDFSVRGGTENVDYFVSLGYFNEGGLFRSNDLHYDRYNFRSNLGVKLTSDLQMDMKLSGRYSDREYPGGDGFIWMYKGTVISYPQERPYINDDPNYPANIFNQQNAVLMSQRDYAGYTNNQSKFFQSSLALTWDIPFVDGLKAIATLAYDSRNLFNKNVWKNYKVYNQDLTAQLINPPRISNSSDDGNRIVFQGQLNYDKTIAEDHNLSGTLVYEVNKYNNKHAYLFREYEFFTTDVVDYASGIQTNQGNEVEQATMSYIGRFNYDFRSKYMLGASFRYDGSYRYAPDSRWAFFPSLTAGWRISEENFFKTALPFVSEFKLRGSYGKIGENVGDPFQHVLGFVPQPSQGAEFNNGSYTGGLGAPGIINPNFTWVKSTISDIGIDGSLFDRKFSFEVDYYQRDKTGKLKTRQGGLPNTFGGSMPIENLESERTYGFDFVLGYKHKGEDFSWGLSGNMNLARTMHRIVDQAEARSSNNKWRSGYANRWNDYEWGYNQIGQFQNFDEINTAVVHGGDLGNSLVLPGDYTYEDVNGDGIIDNKDMLPIFRNRNPKLFYGFVLDATWKGFDLNAVLQGAALNSIRFNEVFSLMFFNNGNVPAYFYDRWHLEDPYNPNSNWVAGEWPASRFSGQMNHSYRESQVWRRNASYLRLKSLEIGYSLPSEMLSKYKLKGVRVYANGLNLLTFSDSFLKQFDPERYEGDYLAGYNYPMIQSFNFGVNVSF